jgi:hypothetical protein
LSNSSSAVLGVSRVLLHIWRVLNLLTGAALIACFVASFLYEPQFREFFLKQPGRIDAAMLVPILRVWMLLALPVIAAVQIMIAQLLAMVATVRAGDPFVPENGARMKRIAWCMLGLQLFDLACGAMAAAMNAAGSNIDWSFSATGWVGVALLFVLARVFEEGARIRAELEAMI